MGDPKAIDGPPCDHIKRPEIDWTVDQDLIKRIATEFRTLPSFENTSYEYILTRHNSLERNEYLKCHWKQYKNTIETKVVKPFEFPATKDLHFYNGTVRFLPNLTLSRQKSFKMQMKPGPGIDFKGQMYIPYEMFMKRGISQKEGVKKRVKEGKKEKKEEIRDEKDISKDKKEIKKDVKITQRNVKIDKNTKGGKKDNKTDKKVDKSTKKVEKTDLKKDDKGPENGK